MEMQYKKIHALNALEAEALFANHLHKAQGMAMMWESLDKYVDIYYGYVNGHVEEVQVFLKSEEEPLEVYSVRMNSYLACMLDTAESITRTVRRLL